MITIEKDKVLNLSLLNCLYEINIVKERIRLFEKKYKNTFGEFEDRIRP